MTIQPIAAGIPVVDDVVVARLRLLRDQVARPGEDVLGELLALFERDALLRLHAIAEAIRAGSSEGRRQAAHALKGSAGNVGAARVAALAAHVENNPCLADVVARLEQEIAVAVAALRLRLA